MDGPDRIDDEALSPVARLALDHRATAQERGTLSPADSEAYRAAVHFMRRVEGRERKWIADLLRITPSAVTKLLSRRPTSATTEAQA